MRILGTCCLLLLGTSLANAAGPTLAEARLRWLKGNYEEAKATYETLSQDEKSKIPAILGISKCWESLGEYDKALEVVDTVLATSPTDVNLLARRAELLHFRGRWEDAEKSADKALAANPNCFLARWVRGQIYRDRADIAKADVDLRWFVRTYTERSNNDNDIKNADELLLVGLAGSENARWHNLADQFRVILTDVYGDASKSEKEFWPAEYQAGMLLLEKYNRGEALDAFEKALTINPNAAEVLVGKGQAALQKYDIKDAEHFAQRALRINPNLPDALRLRADMHLVSGDLKAARADLDRALKINPRDEQTLGRIAALLHIAKDKAGFETLAKEVTRFDPKPGIFYLELAEVLEARKLYDASEKYYKLAAELRPMLPWPNNSLGLLYLRLGREKEAREVLDKAFKVDEFNVRVSNSLKVLRHLEKYETLQTEHFELRFDPLRDKRLAHLMAKYMESIYADLGEKFEYRPEGRILVELFNNHEMFSGRTVALPDLHTIAACTGRVMAMVSPSGEGMRKPFNWVRVLRHELVHIFNLEQTRFQLPHWFTEGLAVINEGFPRPQPWNQMLRQRVPAGDIMNLDNIDLGFIRPKSPADWHMAYCQSQLYVEFMKSKYGAQTIGGMLAAYRDGLDTAAAIVKVCKVDKKVFEEGYRAYLDEVVKSLHGRPTEKALSFSQLQRLHETEPENLDAAARLSEQYLIRKMKKEARQLVEAVLAKQERQPVACYVKARLLMEGGQDEEAQKLLEVALDRENPEPKIVQALGKLYFEFKDFGKAAEVYELAHKSEPYESRWLVELVRVYTQAGDTAKRIDTLIKLVPTDADDIDTRKRLAQLLLDAKRYAEAERYARESLEIDVRDGESQETLDKALRGQNKTKEADEMRKLLGY